jgi:tetratricopeptide (TPR) repeat protein
LVLKYSEARVVAQECLAIYRAHKDQHGEIDGLLLLARIMLELTEVEQSLEIALQALALSRSLGDKYREARSLMRVGECRWELTTYRDFTYIEQAIHLHRELKNWSGLAACTGQAGRLVLLNGNLQAAEKYTEESISLFRQLENKSGLGGALELYGRIALARGDPEKAHTFLRESTEIWQEIGERKGYLWSRSDLGYCTLRQGDIAAARHIFSETAQEFFKEKVEIGVVFNLEGMAGLYIAEDKPAFAARLIGWADATRERIKDARPPLEQPEVDKIIAACLANMGEVAFSAAYEAGRQMSLEDAVEYALRDPQNP